jgi:hypothetical protein
MLEHLRLDYNSVIYRTSSHHGVVMKGIYTAISAASEAAMRYCCDDQAIIAFPSVDKFPVKISARRPAGFPLPAGALP